MSAASPVQGWLARAIAVAAPVALLFGASRWFGAPPASPNDSHRAEVAQGLADRLAATPPGILFVGNSKAMTDIDPEVFTRTLGYERPVFRAEVPASGAPAWYAFLRQRVFGAGYQPDLIVVYGTLAGMLDVQQGAWWAREHAANQQLSETQRLQRKLLGGRLSARVDRAQERGDALRTAAIDGVRDAAVGLLFGGDGHAIASAALDAEFGQQAVYYANTQEHVGPVVESDAGFARAEGVDANQSLVPDLIGLARSHGAAIVFVRAPLPEGARQLDAVPPDRERAALLTINSGGAGWLDLSHIALPTDAFGDFIHLSESGRAVVSQKLASWLAASGVLQGGALPQAQARVAPERVTREGPAVDLGLSEPVRKPDGYACTWLQPAPSLGFLAADALTALGLGPVSPLVATVEGQALRSGDALDRGACGGTLVHAADGLYASPAAPFPDPAVRVGVAPEVPLVAADGTATWWVYPGGAVRFAFEQPWDRPTFSARVRARVLGTGGATLEAGGQRVPLVARGRVFTATIDGPAPASPWSVAVHADPGAWVVVDELALGGDPALELVGRPLEAFDVLRMSLARFVDRPLPTALPAYVSIDAVQQRVGEQCPPLAPAAAPTDPLSRVACWAHGGQWMLPGDTMQLAASIPYADVLRLGGDVVRLRGVGFGDGPVSVRLTVRARVPDDAKPGTGAVLATGAATFPPHGGAVSVDVPLDAAVAPRTPVEVDLETEASGGYLLVQDVRLAESEGIDGGAP